jgi:hypothetical protein
VMHPFDVGDRCEIEEVQVVNIFFPVLPSEADSIY